MADSRTLSYTAEQIDAILAAAQRCSNRNLLDNWYFPNPVDQRGGYVVPPDTPYYSDTDLTTQAGTVSAYTKATNINGSYGTITVSGTTYYVAWSAAVRGYTGEGYGIDRWFFNSGVRVVVEQDGISVSTTAGNTNPTFFQKIDGLWPAGKTLTFSVFAESGMYSTTATIPQTIADGEYGNISTPFGALRLQYVSVFGCYIAVVSTTAGTTAKFIAAKLELGDHQTLAHQDENGNWVLNDPPPDKNMELLKCQRYYQLYSSADKRPVKAVDCRPTMRVDPVQGTIVIDGTTYYYNSAEL